MKFLIVIAGLIAVSHAQAIYSPYLLRDAVLPAVIPPAVPALPVIPPVPATELEEWLAYKEKFAKVVEDRLRRNIYFATKEKVAKHNELFLLGLEPEKLELNIFADYTRDELFNLRSIVDEDQDEWSSFKSTYGKVYPDLEDQFHKTVYFIIKDAIAAHNKLADFGFAGYKLAISEFSDWFHDELPLGSGLLGYASQIAIPVPVAPVAPIVRALPYAEYPYAGYPLAAPVAAPVPIGYPGSIVKYI